jgi:hypothetical protein
MNILEERGLFWWHHETTPRGQYAPEASVMGLLTIEEDGRITLELDGCLPSGRGHPLANLMANDTISETIGIQGILKGTNKHVLLCGLHRNGGHFSSNGISYEKYLAINCLVGNSPPPSVDLAALRFAHVEVELEGFDEWLRLGAIEFNRGKTRLSAKYTKTKDITYNLDIGSLRLKYDLTGPYFGKRRTRKLDLTESASITYTPKKTLTLDAVKKEHQLIGDLLILLTNSDYCLDWPTVASTRPKRTYKLYFPCNRNSAKPPSAHECWTNFLQLRDSFGQIFANWSKKREAFGAAYYLYLGTRRGTKLYVEHRFVNLIWGIESFHRASHPDCDNPKLEAKIERIMGQVTRMKDKKWLTKVFSRAREPSLERRLQDTFKTLSVNLDQDGLEKFSSRCARMRNDISHFGGPRENVDYRKFAKEINADSDALAQLYHVLLLQEIGVSNDLLDGIIHRAPCSYRVRSALIRAGLLKDVARDG